MFPIDRAAPSSRTIFINPNFNKLPPTHINPNFLRAQLNPSIHVNPNFLAKDPVCYQSEAQLYVTPETPSLPKQLLQQNATVSSAPLLRNQIISKSRTKIIRIPMKPPPISSATTNSISPSPCPAPGGLVKIGLRKLVRPSVSSKPKFVQMTNSSQAKYKIDRRVLSETNPIRKRKTSFTGRYALRRSSDSLSKKTVSKFVKRNLNALSFSKSTFTTSILSKNRQLLNINGVLYKSTRNKLERNDTRNVANINTAIVKRASGERAIFVRGAKYLLDKSGFSLTRATTSIPSSQKKSLRRIDIGGLTYVANSKNVLVRTHTHLTRNHVSSARQKSIHLLSKRFVKTNIPCPIFQRVGKCASFERGKCMKVHDKLHVAICSRFLRGECLNKSCLLSHNVSLSKMPVCKFFLQGCCVRQDCPYLHKKLSAKAEICVDFLKGFCKLAQKCNKRHEFVCPDMETKGICEKTKCPLCRKQHMSLGKRKETHIKKEGSSKNKPCQPKGQSIAMKSSPNTSIASVVESEETSVNTRYFAASESKEIGEKGKVSETNDYDYNESDESDEETTTATSSVQKRKRPQLGDLPAFIPFS